MGDADKAQIAEAETRLGRVLRGKWRLDELLGVGGMAAVYAATHRNGKRAAVKVLRPEVALLSDVKARFLREGYLANKVGHPGAVSILDDDTDEDGTVFLVMELLNGETLEQRWARQGNLPWEEMLVIAHQALDVLVAAHEQGIVHRDIKPGNLFVDVESGVKVLDFGIARLQELHLGKSATGHDKALGTPGFMPPEQARGRSDWVDARSDVFGMGATMFAALTGRHVHEADTVNEQLMLAMTAPAPPIAEHASGLPAEVARIVDKALRYERDERYPDARSMRDAIARAYEAEVGSPIREAPRVNVRVRQSRSVHPDAPTVAAPDTGSSTARPVSQGSSVPQAAPAPGSRGRLVAAVAALAVIAVASVGLFASRGNESGAPARAAAAEGVPAASTAVPLPEPARPEPALTVPPSAEPSAAPPASASSSPGAARTSTKAAPRPAKAAPSASPAVDIFQQRK